jgi:tetratricopeptide (TPR) repeat protein
LRQALEVTSGDAERADLLDRLALSQNYLGQYTVAMETAREAIEAFKASDQPDRATRTAGLLAATLVDGGRWTEAIPVFNGALLTADENPELRATLLARLSRAHMRAGNVAQAIEAADLALAIAEPRSMTEVMVEALNNKGAAMDLVGRWREGTLLLEGAFKYADDSVSTELRLRVMNNLASLLDSDNPLRSAEVLTEARELAARWGLRGSLNWLINHYQSVTGYLGLNWDASEDLVTQALDDATDDSDRATLLQDLMMYRLLRGESVDDEFKIWERLAAGKDEVDTEGSRHWLRGWAAYVNGDADGAWTEFVRVNELQPADGGPIQELMYLAGILRDPERIRTAAAIIGKFPGSGRYPLALRAWAGAAVAAIEDRRPDAVAGFLDTDRRLAEIGAEWTRAVVAIDAVLLLPDEPQLHAIAEVARRTLERLRARTHLAELEAALAAAETTKRAPSEPAATAGAAVGRATS